MAKISELNYEQLLKEKNKYEVRIKENVDTEKSKKVLNSINQRLKEIRPVKKRSFLKYILILLIIIIIIPTGVLFLNPQITKIIEQYNQVYLTLRDDGNDEYILDYERIQVNDKAGVTAHISHIVFLNNNAEIEVITHQEFHKKTLMTLLEDATLMRCKESDAKKICMPKLYFEQSEKYIRRNSKIGILLYQISRLKP